MPGITGAWPRSGCMISISQGARSRFLIRPEPGYSRGPVSTGDHSAFLRFLRDLCDIIESDLQIAVV